MNCPAAPRLEATVPDRGSSYAQEGTLAHAYCAKKLKQYLGRPTDAEDREIEELNPTYYSGEMDEYTDTYVAIVLGKLNAARATTPDTQLLVETRLDFSDYVPEAFGTSDTIIIADGLMEVIDFKYGKGKEVSAEDNPQMKIYALGAYLANCFEYGITDVRMTIVQPRIDNFSTADITATELLQWAEEELRPKAQEAYRGDGPQNPGKWCQFCNVKCSCKALSARCTSLSADNTDPRLIDNAAMAEVLAWLPIVKSWATSVEEYALEQALSGVDYPGYKLVEGRSVRKITDPDAVASLLSDEGYNRSEYMKPETLCNITDLEKLVGKKHFAALCSTYITKPQGKPTLVTVDDKRPAFNSAMEDFKNISI